MMTHYDLSLVIASYVVAVLAAYTALFFGARLGSAGDGKRLPWLVTGGLAMGTGVWTMHFVGMRAMPMDMAMTFDTGMTVISWMAAVLASGDRRGTVRGCCADDVRGYCCHALPRDVCDAYVSAAGV